MRYADRVIVGSGCYHNKYFSLNWLKIDALTYVLMMLLKALGLGYHCVYRQEVL